MSSDAPVSAPPSAGQKTYFPNLNGLRFIAAFLVIAHHIEQFRSIFGQSTLARLPFIFVIGKLGVVLFYVLSGFLITYLLLQERQVTGRIDAKAFYLRRVLRIWPLYYTLVLLGLFVLPHIGALALPDAFAPNPAHLVLGRFLFLGFLPNAAILVTVVPYIAPSWSVGVEEQFYLLWPWVLRRFRGVYGTLVAVVLLYLGVVGVLKLAVRAHPDSRALLLCFEFWNLFNIDCMAIGGMAAALLFLNERRVLSVLFNRGVQACVHGATLCLLAWGVRFPVLHFEIYSALFAVIILNLAGNPRRLFSLENPVFAYLGRISYGIYMYHPLAIGISMLLLRQFLIQSHVATYALCTGSAVLLAAVSYHFLERPFLRLKLRYTVIVSGDSAVAAG